MLSLHILCKGVGVNCPTSFLNQTCLLGWESIKICIQGIVGVKLIFSNQKTLALQWMSCVSCNSASYCVINLEDKVSKAMDGGK